MDKPIVVRAGWLIDGLGGPIRSRVRIVIHEKTLNSIEYQPEQNPGPGELDLSQRTILPGLVDSHLHLFMSATADPNRRRQQLEASFSDLLPVMSANAAALLRSGILAVRDGGDHGGFSLRFREKEGMGPLLIRSPGRAWRARGRYGRLIGRPPKGSLGEAVRERISRTDSPALDHVKLVNSGLNSLSEFGRPTPAQFGPDELEAAMAAAHGAGLPVMVHANGPRPVELALSAGCDSVEHGFFMGRSGLELMAGKGAVWVPTAGTMAAYAALLDPAGLEAGVARRNLDHQLAQLSLARELGVKVACGTDAGSPGVAHGPALAREMALMIQAGYSLPEAVAAASSVGARLLKVEDKLGSLEAGRPATFLVFNSSPEKLAREPAKLLAEPEAVYIAGRRLTDRDQGVNGGSDADSRPLP
jgi:imidazolonepropionase-like amidohydrolase